MASASWVAAVKVMYASSPSPCPAQENTVTIPGTLLSSRTSGRISQSIFSYGTLTGAAHDEASRKTRPYAV